MWAPFETHGQEAFFLKIVLTVHLMPFLIQMCAGWIIMCANITIDSQTDTFVYTIEYWNEIAAVYDLIALHT